MKINPRTKRSEEIPGKQNPHFLERWLVPTVTFGMGNYSSKSRKKAALVSRLSLVPRGWNFVTFLVLFKGDSDWKGQNPTSNKPRLAKTQLRSTFIFHL